MEESNDFDNMLEDMVEETEEERLIAKTASEFILELEKDELQKQYSLLTRERKRLQDELKEISSRRETVGRELINLFEINESTGQKYKEWGNFSVKDQVGFAMAMPEEIKKIIAENNEKELEGLKSINSKTFNSYMKEIKTNNPELYDQLTAEGAVRVTEFKKLYHTNPKR